MLLVSLSGVYVVFKCLFTRDLLYLTLVPMHPNISSTDEKTCQVGQEGTRVKGIGLAKEEEDVYRIPLKHGGVH